MIKLNIVTKVFLIVNFSATTNYADVPNLDRIFIVVEIRFVAMVIQWSLFKYISAYIPTVEILKIMLFPMRYFLWGHLECSWMLFLKHWVCVERFYLSCCFDVLRFSNLCWPKTDCIVLMDTLSIILLIHSSTGVQCLILYDIIYDYCYHIL